MWNKIERDGKVDQPAAVGQAVRKAQQAVAGVGTAAKH